MRKTTAGLIAAIAAATLLATGGSLAARASREARHAPGGADIRLAFAGALPRLEGERLKATLVEVTYPPGVSSPPHSHPCPVVGYVVSGAIRTQVKGDSSAVYHAGETFYEPPDGVHLVSANASDREPAKLLAWFVCDRDAPLAAAPPPEGR